MNAHIGMWIGRHMLAQIASNAGADSRPSSDWRFTPIQAIFCVYNVGATRVRPLRGSIFRSAIAVPAFDAIRSHKLISVNIQIVAGAVEAFPGALSPQRKRSSTGVERCLTGLISVWGQHSSDLSPGSCQEQSPRGGVSDRLSVGPQPTVDMFYSQQVGQVI